ncbi:MULTISPECIES: ROK family protein [unclassified Microbacterium]|uniref:ROK family protein n=1 Tax=unclassified Microbacterium TaxID=2609290 RepID=UPI000EA90CCA|nr:MULTISPECIES: ROK family protein [unclassified Microbacterium]MBT2483606.1 ROK family transcriptional regulator [Microbacterium sp. ISL-108]RKN69411.1 ROK family transcriptional regulator [Microbacterium sp. CGR2]
MSRPLAGPQSLLRTLNGRAVLESLARSGAQTRTELMAATGLSRTAVTQVIRMLDSAGAIAAAGVDRDTRGPAAGRVKLHPRLGFAAAVHIDHHAAHVALVDATGAVRAEQHAAFPAGEDRVAHIAALIDGCRPANAPVHLVVVGVPGIVTPDGGIRDDLGPDGGAFRGTLGATLDCPVRVENDVNLAALAELTAGVGGEFASFALLVLDDALGAGIVLDGALHRGFSGVAGEVMYLPQTPLPIGAPIVNEAVVGDLALGLGLDVDAPLLTHLEAAGRGDEAAGRLVAEVAKRIVLVAGSVGLVLDPEAFVLGGDAAHPVLRDAIERYAESLAAQLPLRFVASSFGPEAPLVGAIGEAASTLRAALFTRILTPSAGTGR